MTVEGRNLKAEMPRGRVVVTDFAATGLADASLATPSLATPSLATPSLATPSLATASLAGVSSGDPEFDAPVLAFEAGARHADGRADDGFWRGLFEQLSEGFILGEVLRGPGGEVVDWRYLEVNAAWERMVCVPRERALGRTVRELFSTSDLSWIGDLAEIVDGTRGSIIRPMKAHGNWFEGRAFCLGGDRFALLFLDVTDRHAAEAEARRLAGLVEQSTDFIALSEPDGALRFINPAGLRMVGLPDVAAARAIAPCDFFAAADRDFACSTALPAMRRDGSWEGELNFRDFADGGSFPVLYNIFALRDRAGAITGFGTVARDMRERRAGERRRAALLELGDRLRNLRNPNEMAQVATEIMTRTLDASRAGYGNIDLARETIEIAQESTAIGVSGIAGTYRFRDFGSFIEDLSRGDTVVIADVAVDPRTASNAQQWRGVDAIAVVNHPIFEHGRFEALFYVQQTVRRVWTEEEVAFIRNVADRTRSAVERRRAEDSLRDLAASLELQVAARTEDRDRLWRLSTEIMLLQRFDGTVTAINPAWSEILGWSDRDLLDRPLQDFIHPEDRAPSRAARAALLRGEKLARLESRIRHQDGSYRWLCWTAVAGGGMIVAVGRDITAERAQREALEASEARLRSVFETSYQFLGLLAADGSVIDANPTSLAAIGLRLADVRGVKFWDTPWFSATPGMPERVRGAVARVAAGETFRREAMAELPSGRRLFDFAMRPVFNAAREVIAIVPEAMELTERRAAEEQLRQSQKMEAVGQLTGGLAHDFNNLLTAITGGLTVLRARLAQGRMEDVERYLTAVESTAARATSLTQRLLAFSRQQALDPKTLCANMLVRDLSELLQRTVGPEITVQNSLPEGLWPTRCDPNQLENALLNLAINARDAMPEGGSLTVATGNRTLDAAAARERDLPPGDYVTISVADTGSGMPAEIIARAFDPFFTTKPAGQGTGLGLSMVYGFVKQSGGNVRIVSALGEGTSVELFLPRDSGGVEAAAPVEAPAAVSGSGGGKTVLVVDDEPFVAMLITDVLEELGYEFVDAANGAAAMNVLKSDRKVDLLITDVGLPGGMNGHQLAALAREVRPGLPVLFVTGYADSSPHLDGTADMQTITKPFAVASLAARIEAMLRAS